MDYGYVFIYLFQYTSKDYSGSQNADYFFLLHFSVINSLCSEKLHMHCARCFFTTPLHLKYDPRRLMQLRELELRLRMINGGI